MALLLSFLPQIKAQTTIYVSPTGTGSGASEASPQNVYNAFDGAFGPGTTVIFLDGTYNMDADLYLWNRSGSAAAPIVLKAKNKHMAILKGNNAYSSNRYGVLFIAGSKHVVVDGLTVMHDASSLDQQYGISVTTAVGALGNGVPAYAEYVTVKNCKVFGHGGGGISSADADHIIFENNIVYNNCTRSALNTSGISIYKPRALTNDGSYWSMIIRGNVSYNNKCELPFYYNENGTIYQSNTPTDGNGIILDLFDNDGGNPKYGKRTLIENNVCYKNGGTGIKIYKSSLARIVNNTVYHNNYVLNLHGTSGQIVFYDTGGVGGVYNESVYNNVVVTDPALTANEDYAMIVDFDMNKVYNNYLIGKGAKNTNYVYTEAGFATANIFKPEADQDAAKFQNAAAGNFNLKSTSPLINADPDIYYPTLDNIGTVRPQSTKADFGAFEFVSLNSLTINPETVTIPKGTTTTLTPTFAPVTASEQAVTWTSSNPSIATVNAQGVVTGLEVGNVTITATSLDGAKTSTSLVTINNLTTLAVNLLSFKAFTNESTVSLTWNVNNETNFSHYEILSGIKSNEMKLVGKILANGSSNYSFMDTNPQIGLNYYQLKMINKDGTNKFSKIINLNFDNFETTTILNNPSLNGKIQIKTSILNPTINLYSIAGKRMNVNVIKQNNNIYEIILKNDYVSGIYNLNITNNGKLKSIKVFMK